MEYKIEAVARWKLAKLTELASVRANELARDGWKLEKMRYGWSGCFWTPTIFLQFVKE